MPLCLYKEATLGCVSNSDKLLQGPTMYNIYIQFFITRSGDFVGTPPRVKNIRGGGARDRKCMWFQTYSHPEFKLYDEIFYPADEYKGLRRKKRVPENIHELLNARSLAYWFMDDGFQFNMTKKKRRYQYYAFSTNSFPLEDQKILVEALNNNFSIHTTIQKERSYYRI